MPDCAHRQEASAEGLSYIRIIPHMCRVCVRLLALYVSHRVCKIRISRVCRAYTDLHTHTNA